MRKRKIISIFQSLAYGIIRMVGVGIFIYLTIAALTGSQYMLPQTKEISVNLVHTPGYHILVIGLTFCIVFPMMWFEMKLPEKKKVWIERFFLAVSMLWTACGGFWWINSMDRIPEGDQAFVYGGASYFLEGQYFFLGKGSYCSIYPHQLGLIALVELLFLAVGTYNYFAVEVICVWMAVGIVFLGYCLMKELSVPFAARIFYCLLIMGCVPLICYTSWVYGDVPSIFFAMLTGWLVLRWHNRSRKRYLAGMVPAVIMAVLVRKNSMILLIALSLLAVVYVICFRRWQIAVAVLLAIAGSFLAYQGIYKMYEVRSGYEHIDGLPPIAWIAMGMSEQERDGKILCGWYSDMPKVALFTADFDYEETKELMKDCIEERISVFAGNPNYAAWFFKNKLLSQWNDPLYQSIYFSAKSLESYPTELGSFLDGLYNGREEHDKVLRFADIMQSLVYFGMLLYYLFAIRKTAQPFAYLLAVTIIGGFLFSILWEAKARYIFPYYVMMYPLAAIGYFSVAEKFAALKQNFSRNNRAETRELKAQ